MAKAKTKRNLDNVIADIEEQLEDLKTAKEKLVDKGVKSASTKVRGNFQEIKKLCQEGRVITLEIRQDM